MIGKIELLSNGMIENYPKLVYMDNMRVKHFKDLLIAAGNGEEAFKQVLTAVYDDLVDWEKTKYIKTTDDLTYPDRHKLFIYQRVNSKGSKYELIYKCSQCGEETIHKFDLLNLKEIRLKKKIEKKLIEDKENDITLVINIPTRNDMLEVEKHVREYKIEVFNKIEPLLYINEIKSLKESSNVQNFEEKKNMLQQIKNTKFDIKDKDGVIEKDKIDKVLNGIKDKESSFNVNNIKKSIDELQQKALLNYDEVTKILNSNNFENVAQYQKYDEIEIYDDLYFDNYTDYILILGSCIKNKPKNYIQYMLNLPLGIIDEIDKCTENFHHAYKNIVTYRCKKCNNIEKEDFVIYPSFFLK